MDNKILIGFLVFLAAFLVLPVAMQQIRGPQAQTAGVVAADNKTSPVSAPLDSELNRPPLLNEMNLVGTEWSMTLEQYTLKVSVAAGGVIYATHPLLKAITGVDYLEGRWRLEYDKVYITASFGGKEHSITLKISGDKMYYLKDGKYAEVKRYM